MDGPRCARFFAGRSRDRFAASGTNQKPDDSQSLGQFVTYGAFAGRQLQAWADGKSGSSFQSCIPAGGVHRPWRAPQRRIAALKRPTIHHRRLSSSETESFHFKIRSLTSDSRLSTSVVALSFRIERRHCFDEFQLLSTTVLPSSTFLIRAPIIGDTRTRVFQLQRKTTVLNLQTPHS